MMPHDVDAEQALLGCLLFEPPRLASWAAQTAPDIFYSPANQRVFAAAKRVLSQHGDLSMVTLRDELVQTGGFEKAGGPGYLMDLCDTVATSAGWERYRDIVHRDAQRRRILGAMRELDGQIQNGGKDVDDIREALWGMVQSLTPREQERTLAMTEAAKVAVSELETRANGDTAAVLPTGFPALDDKLNGGLHPRHYYCVAARTSMGKTSLVESICRNILLRTAPDATVLFFTLETGTSQTVVNLFGQEASIPTQRLQRGTLSDADWADLTASIGLLSPTKLHINQSARLTPETAIAEARKVKMRHGLSLVVVDYVQKLRTKGRTKEEETAAASDTMCLLARELDSAVLAVAQLNRQPDGRADTRPMLSDLRYSGQLEMDADAIMLLHRPGYYDRDADPTETGLCLAKNRNGPTGTVPLTWIADAKRFEPAV